MLSLESVGLVAKRRTLEAMLLESMSLESMDEQQWQSSPVDVATKIREELAEFQRTGSCSQSEGGVE